MFCRILDIYTYFLVDSIHNICSVLLCLLQTPFILQDIEENKTYDVLVMAILLVSCCEFLKNH